MMEILTALLVVAAVGLIAGIMLALASHFFGIEEDETVAKIRACLPGANCGACGYTGCDGYAEALANGKAEANLCTPGGAEVAKKLSAVLGCEVEVGEPVVAVVACGGDCDAVKVDIEYEGIYSCKAASMLYGGPSACKAGCIGCGDCADVCPVDAICVANGLAHVDPRVCIACGKCVKTCPKGIIEMVPRSATVAVLCNNTEKGGKARQNCEKACIGCKKCEKLCPSGAITVTNNLADVDYEKCTGCGDCAERCPTGCLVLVDLINGKYGR